MPTFVFTYRRTAGYTPAPDSAGTWMAWFEGMDGRVADIGQPAAESAAIGNCGPGTEMGGYSLITADDLDAALQVAKGCPALAGDGGVEVARLRELPSGARETASAAGRGQAS